MSQPPCASTATARSRPQAATTPPLSALFRHALRPAAAACCRERILHITHVLADVYEETPNPDERIKQAHRARARAFMQAVEANDVEK